MKQSVPFALVLSLLAAPAAAHSYRVVLNAPGLVGHAGVQAIDDKTSTALVRVISPGAEVRERGTVRVLVMNLGAKPFPFGAPQVTLTLADGTVLQPTPLDQFVKGKDLVERESRYAATVDMQNRNNLSALESQQSSGMTAQSAAPVPGGSSGSGTSGSSTLGQDQKTDSSLIPGAQTLDAINQVLDSPLDVAPQKAWGGYYVFDVPKAVFARRADQPLTILVTTGAEQHRFDAILKWK
ncbi:MAG: hypothetical protein QOF34_368 [Sphingomonadales bacterium]|nr:hypothetical protein [Sphingomonadales bacterium]